MLRVSARAPADLDGSTALWFMAPTGNQASYLYGPVAGWTAVDVSVGPDNTTHILRTNVDGRTGLTRLDGSRALVSDATYGPYSGWVARSISHGADGLTRVLWNKSDGSVGLSLIDAGAFSPPSICEEARRYLERSLSLDATQLPIREALRMMAGG